MNSFPPTFTEEELNIAIVIEEQKEKNNEWAPEFLYIEDSYVDIPSPSVEDSDDERGY